MKSTQATRISRRSVLSALAALPVLPAPFLRAPALAQAGADPLPSWNDGAAKQAIIAFVRDTTDRSNSGFVTPEARIATIDQDGTLWVGHPMYTQVIYCLERVPAVVAERPKLKNAESFKTALSGNREAIAKLPLSSSRRSSPRPSRA
jgi:hypothetical protein